eukprot:gene14576-16731_t
MRSATSLLERRFRALFVLLFLACAGALDYAKHGAVLNLVLDNERETLISYEIAVEGLRRLESATLPRESNTDSLQIRCLIDGVPLRYSSSVSTTYLVEQRMLASLSATFAANLSATNHTIILQWKKTGNQLDKWVLQTDGPNSKFIIAAQADFDKVSHLHELNDEFLFTPDVWKPLSGVLSFYVDRERTVTLGYSFTVQPQLFSFVKDRTMEYIMSRISVDGTAFVESGETFGTNGWNPSSHVMKGTLRLKLNAGHHTAQLEWRKRGNIFKSWGSSPSSMDGFASSRNMYILLEKFDPPTYASHTRHMTPSNNDWANVNNAASTLTFTLVKESAVLFTYALPVTQHENPNFDSNVWSPLSTVDARLVVDDTAYSFQGGDTLALESREFNELFGSLPLILPAGSHSVSLQWRSNGFRWTTLNDIDSGFAHSDILLMFITSENAQPTITRPEVVYGVEDVLLVISNVRVDDVDDQLAGGVIVSVNLTVQTGMLAFPNAAFLANPIEYTFGVHESTMQFTDSIANINVALLNLTYTAPLHWNGEDSIVISISDQSNTGYGANAQTDEATIRIIIRPVDNMFTVTFPSPQSLPDVSALQLLAPMKLEDIDTVGGDFRVQLSATCGQIVLNVSAISPAPVTFYLGDGTNDTAVDFQATYATVQTLLLSVRYSPDVTCNEAVHQEAMIVRVTDVNNPAQDLTQVLSIRTLRENLAPEILTRQQPRFTLDGLSLVPTEETASAMVNYTQYPVLVKTTHDLTKTTLQVDNMRESAAPSELAVFTTDAGTFALNLQFEDVVLVTMESSNFIQANKAKVIVLRVGQGISANLTSAGCVFGAVTTAAVIDREKGLIQCNVTFSDADIARSSSIGWLKTIFSVAGGLEGDSTVESNYLPLFLSPALVLQSVHPMSVLPQSRAVLRLQANVPGVVHRCVFALSTASQILDSIIVPAIVQEGAVLCRLPDLPIQTGLIVSVKITDTAEHFVSNSITLAVLSVPVIDSASVVTNKQNSVSYLTVKGLWDYEAIESAVGVFCVLNKTTSVVASSAGQSEILCELAGLDTVAPNTSVHVLFGAQSTNSIIVNITAEAESATAAQLSGVLVRDTFAASAMEESFLTVLGDFTHLAVSPAFKCNFGSHATTPELLDDYTLLCPIPAGRTGGFALGSQIIVEDLDTAENMVLLKVPTVSSVAPVSGRLSGGDEIVVTGTGFSPLAALTCRIGDVLLPGIYQSESALRCVTPPHAAGAVSVTIIANDVYAFVVEDKLSFNYVANPTILALSPAASPLSGGVSVTVHGAGFAEAAQPVRCYFGDTSVRATVVSDSEITCVSPSAVQDGPVPFRTTFGKIGRSSGSISFQYLRPVFVVSVAPSRGSTAGNETILMHGTGFVPTAATECVFGAVKVPARVVSDTVVECVTPTVVSAGPVSVGISIEGLEYMQQMPFTFTAAPTVVSVSPVFGPPQGGTNVTVFGTGFSAETAAQCKFGTLTVPASYVSATVLVCSAPANSVGQVDVSVSMNGITLKSSADASLSFAYVDLPSATAVFPAAAPFTGGTIVTVQGEGFLSLNWEAMDWEIFCQFGEQKSVAAVQSNTSLTCLVPGVPTASTVELSVVINGLRENAPSPVLFRYIDSVAVTAVQPQRGSALGGETVLVSGLSLPTAASLECFFGDTAVPARVVNSSVVECISPSSTAGKSTVALSVDGYRLEDSAFVFEFVAPIELNTVHPAYGFTHGGTNLTITGSGFVLGSTLTCLFGDIPRPALFLSETSVTCVSPAHLVGDVNITVVDSSAAVHHPQTVQFTYIDAPRLTGLNPRAGPLNGDSVVTINGTGFPTETVAWSAAVCRFGDITVPAQVISEQSLQCTVPASMLAGAVSVNVLWNGDDESVGSLTYHYLKSTVLTDIQPRVVTASASGSVLVTGQWFPPAAQVECLFGEVETFGRVVNSVTIECTLPEELSGTVTVGVRIDGYTLPESPSTVVLFTSAMTVTSIDVTRGVTAGGTNVTVS